MAKIIIFSFLVALALFSASQIESFAVQPRNNDFIIGTLRPGSVLVVSQRVNVTGIPNQIITRNVTYNVGRNVSLIQAFDQNNNRTGGYASLVSGGVNQRAVIVGLRSSAVGRAIDFIVNIYAV